MAPVLETSLRTALPASEVGTCLALAVLHPAGLLAEQPLDRLPISLGGAPSRQVVLED